MSDGGSERPPGAGTSTAGGSTTINNNGPMWAMASRALDWLLGQQGNTVALFTILGAIGYFGWYAINHAIPAHLTQIQTGYEKIEQQQTRQLETVSGMFEKRMDSVTGAFEKRDARADGLLRDILDLKKMRKVGGEPADQ